MGRAGAPGPRAGRRADDRITNPIGLTRRAIWRGTLPGRVDIRCDDSVDTSCADGAMLAAEIATNDRSRSPNHPAATEPFGAP